MDKTISDSINTLHWHCAASTDTGNIRSINQDNFIARSDAYLWAVADGMGGHHGGEIASQLIVDDLARLSPDNDSLNSYINQIESTLMRSNDQLRQMCHEQFDAKTIGSTIVCMIAKDNKIAYLWAGDSRLYRLRRGQLTQLTTDHSEIQQLLENGLVSPEHAKNHPAAHVITRAVGGHESLALQIGLDTLQRNDIYLLCSDGLYRDLSEAEMRDTLDASTDVRRSSKLLMEKALSRSGADNITLIVTQAVAESNREQ